MLPWAALKHHLDLIVDVGGQGRSYWDGAHARGTFYINDALSPVAVNRANSEGR